MGSSTKSIDLGAPRAAVELAQAALASGDVRQARAWLERAQRTSGGDPTVRFLLASALAETDLARATSMMRDLVREFPTFREAHIGLIAFATKAGDVAAATSLLRALLSRQAAPDDPRFRALANAVAFGDGAPGWVSAAADGRVRLGIGRIGAGGGLLLELDGARVPVPRNVLAGAGAGGGERTTLKLPERWRTAAMLTAAIDGQMLLGSPVDLRALRAVEGFVVSAGAAGISGWAWHPADPATCAALTVEIEPDGSVAAETFTIVADDESHILPPQRAFERHRGFVVPANRLAASAFVRIGGPNGQEIAGSPVWVGAAASRARAVAASLAHIYPVAKPGRRDAPEKPDRWRPIPVDPRHGARPIVAALKPARPSRAARRNPVDVVIPVFRGAGDFRACLATLRGQLPNGARIVVVDDGSQDRELRAAVRDAVRNGDVVTLRHPKNRGFPAAANTGFRHALAGGAAGKSRDVLLLNPDTLLPPGAIARLVRVAYAAVDIGSVTPMTNDGTIVSYPSATSPRPAPSGDDLVTLDAAFHAANGGRYVELPTAVGFCMYIRADCLAEVGAFRDDVFAQGYGEENDWCLRASHLGWRHVAATGVFVAHAGGRSFGAVKANLIERNIQVLNTLHPGYDAAIQDFIARDPLAHARRGVDLVRWRANRAHAGSILLATHAKGGGVQRYVGERAAAIRSEGLRPIQLRPTADGDTILSDDASDPYLNLRFTLPAELDLLAGLLTEDRPGGAEIHHFLGHGAAAVELIDRLGLPTTFYVHDSAQWCPRITLTSPDDRYCGEPNDVAVCKACVRDYGARIGEDIGVEALRARSAQWLSSAARVVVSCRDARHRLRRQFPGIDAEIVPWEDDSALAWHAQPPPGRDTAGPPRRPRVIVSGAIGPEKGYNVLLGCARDAERRGLPLEFVLVGHSKDDGRLLETGRVFVTGRYEEEDDLASLISEQHGDLGFVPSICPETWCYTLSALWLGGLRVAAFALGAQSERIHRTGAGWVIPVGLPISRVNDFLLELCLGKSARRASEDFVSDLPTSSQWNTDVRASDATARTDLVQ